ncbi:MAG: Gfo/Idh/MocA family oxidoreductase [Ignavibacteriales bacterium]|nr:Gfo/Idh/MocA family oxidoreductase [Ignavibacteriales bacterium]MCB9208721.1 Gfo/Idh/MocA family oxidoreductase [Ignavibacteriales bacterium]MCB9218361.1 Gfo/Idh/MocA family oxidoreductase [Ignavibacteriales bacterium]MCB9260657.1 Gfo/Idh/MocA family oxidoreductase [Ignavibacteriales bacterium]
MAENENKPKDENKISRRDIIKGFSTVPILGVFAYDYWKKKTLEKVKNKAVQLNLGLDNEAPKIITNNDKGIGEVVKVGIIGVGGRGTALLKAAGFLEKGEYEDYVKQAKNGDQGAKRRLETYQNQSVLNIQVIGICDVFDLRAEKGIDIVSNGIQPNGESANLKNVKRYLRYQELLADPEIDAVIIATPDFHHAHMTIDAVRAGKHVYCEKAMTLTEDELHKVYAEVKKSGVVFQLGHQNSKNETFKKAKEIVDKNIIGKVTLIETTTNRNSRPGAWIRHLDGDGNPKPGSPETIDWGQWLGHTPKVPFSIERYYGWARFFDYDTGLAGQLFSHEIDALNQIMGFGIPKSVVSSGGIYFYKDIPRDMPDTFNSVLEFPDREFTMLYSATLANSRSRGRVFMGHDASMEVGGSLKLIANGDSTQYKDKIKNGIIDPSKPFYTYPESNIVDIDGITSPTEKYYAERGLIDTNVGGKNLDITHLHVKEWIDVIRNGGETGCNIEKAFDDTVSVLMVHKSYVENRKVEWDPVKRRII